jgi:DNA polymerase-3 subunit alpha
MEKNTKILSVGELARRCAADEGRAEPEFIHLHVHTQFSMLDGAAKIEDIVKLAKDRGSRALAITDHGNMYGAIKFYQECMKYPVYGRNADSKKPQELSEEEFTASFYAEPCKYTELCPKADKCDKGKDCKIPKVKPLIGCEFYCADDLRVKQGKQGSEENPCYHLILIAKDMQGYHNLAKLNSIAFLEGRYYKPRIDLDALSKHSQGLVCTTACLAGAVSAYLLQNRYEDAKNYALRLQSIIGKEDFYIELQDHNLEEQRLVNPLLIKLAREIGAKLVATNDVHYLKKEHSEMHDVLLCIQTAARFTDEKRMRFEGAEFYFKDYEEMRAQFYYIEEALTNTVEIAEKCDVEFVFHDYKIPQYTKVPEGMTAADYLRKLTREGLTQRYGKNMDAKYTERAEAELEVIIGMNFTDYFLIVWDFIYFAKSNGIPVGPGRGSGVGSLVAYALKITDVDPIKHNLIFERFLNMSRVSMPDFDIDFCAERRGEVIEYVKKLYGEDKIAQIITFGTLAKKQAVKDVARIYDVPFEESNKLTAMIDNNNVKLKDLINPDSPPELRNNELINLCASDELYRKIFNVAAELEGLIRQPGIHAAGIVIFKDPAQEVVPLALNNDEVTTQYNMQEVEQLGLLKMDFLGLRTLTDVRKAVDYIYKRHKIKIDFEQTGYEDARTFELIARGDTDAVFQLEGGGMKKFMLDLQPQNMEDLIAGISLYRPGPMDNIPLYLSNRKAGKINYAHPCLEPILNVTSGVMIYQEQAMLIARAMAGYSMQEADRLRYMISKKKVAALFKEKSKFIERSAERGVDRAIADSVFEDMKKFGGYAFNKSHAAAYAYLGYQTAYLKRYYPVEFMTAVINNRINNTDDTKKYMGILKLMGIELLPPDINKSGAEFTPEGGAIRYGLACIKGIGIAVIEKSLEEREANGEFVDFVDFARRTAGLGLNKRVIQALILGGAFDSLGKNRATLIANYEAIIENEESVRKMQNSNQMSIFDFLGQEDTKDYAYINLKEYPQREKLLKEKEVLGMYMSGHPLAGLEEAFESFNFNTLMLRQFQKQDNDEQEEEREEDKVKEELSIYDFKKTLRFGGILSQVKIRRTQKGTLMASALLEDLYDSVEILLFGHVVEEARDILADDTLVLVEGNLKTDEEKGATVFVSRIVKWLAEEKTQTEEEDKILYIKLDGADKEKYAQIESVLAKYPGGGEVRYFIDGKTFLSPQRISDIGLVKSEVICLVGGDCVKISKSNKKSSTQ